MSIFTRPLRMTFEHSEFAVTRCPRPRALDRQSSDCRGKTGPCSNRTASTQVPTKSLDQDGCPTRKSRTTGEGPLASSNYLRMTPSQVSTIEFSLVEVSVLHGLEQGNEVLKEIHKEMNVESVERLLEETAEAQEYQKV